MKVFLRRLPVFEVVGGLEPPWKVLQTRALPLGHATLDGIQIRGHKNTGVLLVYQISRQLFFPKPVSLSHSGLAGRFYDGAGGICKG